MITTKTISGGIGRVIANGEIEGNSFGTAYSEGSGVNNLSRSTVKNSSQAINTPRRDPVGWMKASANCGSVIVAPVVSMNTVNDGPVGPAVFFWKLSRGMF